MFRQITALSLLAAALPVAAQTAAPSAPAPAPTAKPEKKICRRLEVTGSIMPGPSVCHTKSDWAAIDTANNNAAATSRDTRGVAGGTRL